MAVSSTSRVSWLVFVLVGAVCLPRVALAQPEVEARRLFAEGTEALSSGRFAEARDRFRLSLDRTPNAGTAFNLGVALRGTGEVVEARAVFDTLLDDGYGALRPAQRREIAQLREAVDGEVAVLTLEVGGAPAFSVRVDGRPPMPMRAAATVELNPGAHTLYFSAPERAPEERVVEVERGERRTVAVDLQTPEGTLVLEAAAPDDRVAIGSGAESMGRLERRLPPGRYTVSVRRPSGGERESVVTVSPGETLRVRLDLDATAFDPLPWVGVGLGVLVLVGVGVLVGALLWDPVQDPIADNPDRVVSTLRVAF
ncbi:MAG: hypothetical protein AB8I08_04205 [Sandaracinaceae bacterium]